jgi:hypothetical protein
MDALSSIPLLITGLLGTTGIVTALSRLSDLGEPARLRKRLTATIEAAASLEPDTEAREALELARERDAMRIAAITLISQPPGTSRKVKTRIAKSMVILIGLLALSYWAGIVWPAQKMPAEFRSAYVGIVIGAQLILPIIFVAAMLVIAHDIYTSTQSLRARREVLAASMFGNGVSHAGTRADVLVDILEDAVPRRARKRFNMKKTELRALLVPTVRQTRPSSASPAAEQPASRLSVLRKLFGVQS